jgi:hypothetical protein
MSTVPQSIASMGLAVMLVVGTLVRAPALTRSTGAGILLFSQYCVPDEEDASSRRFYCRDDRASNPTGGTQLLSDPLQPRA